MGVHTTFYFHLKKILLINPLAIFLEHWACPNKNTFLNLQFQNKNNYVILDFTFLVYIYDN
jgi:uncharacterized protein YpiB (UPF0302 family)